MNTKRLLALAGLPIVFAFGCAADLDPWTVEPRRVRVVESLDLPVASQEPTQNDRAATQPGDTPADTLQPEVELTLGRARELALAGNLQLQISHLDPLIARQQLTIEQAFFDTVFTVDASAANIDTPTAVQDVGSQIDSYSVTPGISQQILPTGGNLIIDFPVNRTETNNPFATLNPSWETDGRLVFSQPLLRGFGADATELGLRIATSQYGQSLAQQKLQVTQILAAVDRAYWNLAATARAVEVREQQVELADDQLDRAGRMFKAGEVSETEVVRAESGKADAEEFLLQARNFRRQAQRALQVLLNDPQLPVGGPSRVITATQAVPLKYEVDADDLVVRAMDRRMELLATELRVLEQQARIAAAENGLLPQLDFRYQHNLNGLGGDFGDGVDTAGSFDYQDDIFGLTFSYPLGNRAARARLKSSRLQRLRELTTAESQMLTIRQEVFDAVDALDTSWQRIIATRRRVDLARRLLDAEVRQFEQGLRTSTEVLEAQTNLADAELSLIEALADYEIGRTNLAEATGSVLGKSGVVLGNAE